MACAGALRDAAEAAGVPLQVACVEGDDLLGIADTLRAAGAVDRFTRAPLPDRPLTMNALSWTAEVDWTDAVPQIAEEATRLIVLALTNSR